MHQTINLILIIILINVFINYAKLNYLLFDNNTQLLANLYHVNYHSKKSHKIHKHKIKLNFSRKISLNQKNLLLKNKMIVCKNINKCFFLKCPKPNDKQWKNKVNFLIKLYIFNIH